MFFSETREGGGGTDNGNGIFLERSGDISIDVMYVGVYALPVVEKPRLENRPGVCVVLSPGVIVLYGIPVRYCFSSGALYSSGCPL